jgi:hypothetical protein
MATKHYAQTVQRALDDEIAQLLAQKKTATPEPVPPTGAPAPGFPAPQPAPGTFDGTLADAAPKRAASGPPPAPPSGALAPPPPQSTAPAPAAAPPRFGAAPAMPTQDQIVAGLDQRLMRLMQVRDWIQQDGDIARLLDTVIGNQVRKSERRQARFNIILNVIFLVAGWALSVIASPSAIAAFFHHA